MAFDDLLSQFNNVGIDFDGYYGFQCMDLVQYYVKNCLGNTTLPGPNAVDCWTTYQKDLYDAIPNTPTGVPSKGDILVWSNGVGVNGHIAIFIDGDSNAFTSFDQNWPLGSVCHKQQHNYNNVLGWLHPKASTNDSILVPKADFENLVNKSTKYDAFVAGGFTTVQDVTNKIQSLQDALHNATVDTTALKSEVDQLNTKLKECQDNPNTLPAHQVINFLGRILWLLT